MSDVVTKKTLHNKSELRQGSITHVSGSFTIVGGLFFAIT